MHILGTAGHVDHGKSSLVRALSGTDPDRWIEERLRGMTLDLGFAHLRFDDGVEAGIVDVPGHERFLHNMLAGAAGMEVLLLVVAANEGPKPQTAEHLAILEYLNVRRTIVVLTKADLVDAEELALALDLVRESTAGTFAANAPYVAVSSTTGEGLDALRTAIHDALASLPEREPNAPAFLPIDRVFALTGHGTIVTGTLMQGRIAAGDELALTPHDRTVRVRSVHVFGEKRSAASGGTRVALNVPQIETSDAKRGDVLASAQFATASAIEVTFRAFTPSIELLKRRTPVRAYLGSAELFGTLVFEHVPRSGETVSGVLHLRSPSIVIPGAAYVVRRLTPKTLLGGGTIGAVGDSVQSAVVDDVPEVVPLLAALRKAGIDGLDAARAGGLANIHADRAEHVLALLADEGRVMRLRRPAAYVDIEAATSAFHGVRDRVLGSERAEPWLTGMTSLALARAVDVPEPKLVRVLAAFVDDGALAYRGGYYASPDHVPALTAEQHTFFTALFANGDAGGNVPLAFEAVRTALRGTRVAGAAGAYETLLAGGALVRIDDSVYRKEQILRLRSLLEATLRREKQITVSAFRELAGISRKYAVPLMEWFDATGVTVRSGDVRFLRAIKARA